jgi:vancomycin resistance protein YoaR
MTEIRDVADAPGAVPKKRGGKNKLFLIISGSALLVALAVCAVLLLRSGPAEDTAQRVVEFGTAMQGVSVGGIDISGMTKEEALAATADLPNQLLSQVNFMLDINGVQKTFTAEQFALYTDYETAIEKAIAYGRTGTFDERLAAAKDAADNGVDFPVDILVDEAGLKTALAALKSEMDTPAIDATADFAPWGYTATQNADGTTTYTKYEPSLDEIIEICKAYASGKEYEHFPDLVRLTDEEKPNALRYQYWNDRQSGSDKYVKDYIPREADIARFIYTPEVTGLVVDTDAIFTEVVSQVQSDSYGIITPPVQVTPAAVTLADIKSQTQLIASWSSSFGGSSHYGYNRNYNVAMMSSLLNGSVIDPGEEWSVNDTAGPRNATTARTYGWKEASGIENGGYTPQYGGGVCQLGSTTFNAAIRSGLTVTEHWHHSIPSDYVPIGLDATLNSPVGNSGGKDLKLKNETPYTIYLVSYINPTDRNVTVEFYGVPLTNASGQQIILQYTSKQTGRYGTPVSSTIPVPEGYVCPDGTIISAAGLTSYQFAKDRQGTTAQTYVSPFGLDGVQIGETEEYYSWKYPLINGTLYVLDVPAPSPSESALPSASPEVNPAG